MQITSRLLFAAFLQLFYVSVLARASEKLLKYFCYSFLRLAAKIRFHGEGKEEIAAV